MIRKTRIISFVCVALLMLLIFGAVGIYASPNLLELMRSANLEKEDLSRAHAGNIAKDSFRKLNPKANLEELKLVKLESFPQNFWVARFEQEGEVRIDAAKEEVVFIVNNGGLENLCKKRFDDKAKKITEDEAFEIAQKYIRDISLGFDKKAKLDEVSLFKIGGDQALSCWRVKWSRIENGYPYHDDWIIVDIDAFEGTLLGYHKYYPSIMSENVKCELTEGVAWKIAKEFLETNTNLSLKENSGKLMLVNPNYRWTDKVMLEINPNAILAWTFGLSSDSGQKDGEIWIDAYTDEILGGFESK